MVEERFDRIDARLGRLEAGQTKLRSDVKRLDGRLDKIDTRFVQIDDRFAQIDDRFAQVDARFAQVDEKFAELRTHMGVLYEDALGRIAARSEEPLATRADVQAIAAKIDDLVGGRIVPLEAAVHNLSRGRKTRGPRR